MLHFFCFSPFGSLPLVRFRPHMVVALRNRPGNWQALPVLALKQGVGGYRPWLKATTFPASAAGSIFQ
jgi:hypothetical protein